MLPNWYLLEYSLFPLAKSYLMYQICTFYNTSSTPWKGWPEVEWWQWQADPLQLCSSWGWSRRRSGNHHSPSPQRQHPSLSFSNGFWCKSVLLFRVSSPARASQVGAHLYSHCHLLAWQLTPLMCMQDISQTEQVWYREHCVHFCVHPPSKRECCVHVCLERHDS